jgi:hypothetical protein
MSANTIHSSLRVTELDYFSIRENLKTFLRGQETFSDYDFEGSGMSVLLDMLAYNTYYNSFYLNMVANESFLDTAQVRQNILSHAKVINYVPQSRQGAIAKVNITATPGNTEDGAISYIILDKYTKFIGTDIDGVNHPFVTINANTAGKVNGAFSFSNVVLKQGEVITLQYQMSANNSSRRFRIPSQNVDTTTVVVTVQQSASNTYTEEFKIADDLTVIGANSRVYFIEEDESLKYTIYFGDNLLGKRPANGSIITLTYLDTVGSEANSITRFASVSPIAGIFRDNVIISTTVGSYAGTDKETLEQIRHRAPIHYTTQNRAVTTSDYESIITTGYNNIDAVSIWGGEENDPPIYGKVYMSLKTKGLYSLSNLEKERIKEDLISTRNVLTVIPEIVDPDYCFVLIRGKVIYDPTLTSKTPNELLSIVRNSILDYNTEELNNFKSTFRKSRLQQYIESSDPSITGSDISIFLQKQVTIDVGQTKNYEMKFNTLLGKGDLYQKLYSFPQVRVYDESRTLQDVFYEEVPGSFTGVDAINIVNPGSGYLEIPMVTITGDGSGATAEATIVNGKVNSIKVTNKGFNYTRATISITSVDGAGAGASAQARLEARYGLLRTYYYKANGEKVIVNGNAGTIDYNTGKVMLTSLFTTNVLANEFYPENVLTINVIPEEDIITPLRNRILAIDINNPQNIQIQLVPIVSIS